MEADPPDFELLTRWRDGDHGAGDALLARHVHTLYRFFANKAPDALDDLAQRTLLACVEARDRIDAGRSFRAYLLGIARHQLFGHYRQLRRGQDPAAHSVAELAGSPSRELAAEQERRLLLAGLRRLPLDTQIVLEMYYWEGMGTPEIAAAMDEPEGTIKSRISRGKVMLRDAIAKLDASPAALETTATHLEHWARSLQRLRSP